MTKFLVNQIVESAISMTLAVSGSSPMSRRVFVIAFTVAAVALSVASFLLGVAVTS